MLLINCPWCGPRSEPEFRCGGQAQIERPSEDASNEAWRDYLFTRDNPKGRQVERWHHLMGCGQWFALERDTLTHEIYAAYAFGDGAPQPQDLASDGVN